MKIRIIVLALVTLCLSAACTKQSTDPASKKYHSGSVASNKIDLTAEWIGEYRQMRIINCSRPDGGICDFNIPNLDPYSEKIRFNSDTNMPIQYYAVPDLSRMEDIKAVKDTEWSVIRPGNSGCRVTDSYDPDLPTIQGGFKWQICNDDKLLAKKFEAAKSLIRDNNSNVYTLLFQKK